MGYRIVKGEERCEENVELRVFLEKLMGSEQPQIRKIAPLTSAH